MTPVIAWLHPDAMANGVSEAFVWMHGDSVLVV